MSWSKQWRRTSRAEKKRSAAPIDPQLFYFSATGAADRFFSARLVLRHCFDQDTLTDELRDRYKAHIIDLIMAGIRA